jgi:hypothetical protein
MLCWPTFSNAFVCGAEKWLSQNYESLPLCHRHLASVIVTPAKAGVQGLLLA